MISNSSPNIPTYLESDLYPITLVPLFFAAFYRCAAATLQPELSTRVCCLLVSQFKMNALDVHVLAVVLDPAILKKRLDDLTPFIGKWPFLSVAQVSLDRYLAKYLVSDSVSNAGVRALALHVAETRISIVPPKSYHPFLWRAMIGVERCKLLAEVAYRVFSLLFYSSGIEGPLKWETISTAKMAFNSATTKPTNRQTKSTIWVNFGALTRGRWRVDETVSYLICFSLLGSLSGHGKINALQSNAVLHCCN